MTTVREWLARLLDTFRPRRTDADLEEELRLHLELATEDEATRGLAPRVARQSALARSGSSARALDALRDQRELPRLRDAVHDLRHAVRSLQKAPLFALTAVITLASGLAATATVFSAVDALLIRPLGVTAPHELFVVRRAGETRTRFPLEFYQALYESRSVFTDPVAGFTFPVTMSVSGTGERARAAFVSPNYFDALGVQTSVGRLLQAGDDRDVIVISHRVWRQLFGARRSVVGEVVRVGASAFVVGGVAPPGFAGLQLDVAVDLWLPITSAATAVPLPSFRPSVDIVGRLTGLSPAAATLQANRAYERWSSTLPRPPSGDAPPLLLASASHGLASGVREQFRASLGILLGVCVCLWLMTIVNVSGLLAARLGERSREMALRHALGATTSRLFVQILAEVAVLVSGGLVLGCAAAIALSSALPRWLPAWAGVDVHVSPRVFAVTAVTAALAAFTISLLQSASIQRRGLLRHLVPVVVGFGSGRRLRLSSCLVGLQLAVTLPLIVVAGLLAQSLYHLGRVDTGFERRNLLQVAVEPALVGYPARRASAYYAALTERLRSIPGIVDASVSSGGTLSGYGGFARLRHDGSGQEIATNAVDERYFRTTGIPLLSGRPFTAVEAREDAAVVVVNDALARRMFESSDRAVGQVLTFDAGGRSEQRRVIGVVGNTTDSSLREQSTPAAYLPVAESSLLTVHVRFEGEAVKAADAVRQAAAALDPSVPILSVRTIDERLQIALQRERLLASTSVAIGWGALALSAIGLFGRVSRDVIARKREMVIRSALGATPFQIANLFLQETMRLVVFSLVPGAGLAVAAGRAVQHQVYGVSGTDLSSYLAAAALLTLVAAIATVWPLRRAWRADESAQLLRV